MELVAGHVTFVFNTGNGGGGSGRVLRDASPVVLNDDQWHEVRAVHILKYRDLLYSALQVW